MAEAGRAVFVKRVQAKGNEIYKYVYMVKECVRKTLLVLIVVGVRASTTRQTRCESTDHIMKSQRYDWVCSHQQLRLESPVHRCTEKFRFCGGSFLRCGAQGKFTC